MVRERSARNFFTHPEFVLDAQVVLPCMIRTPEVEQQFLYASRSVDIQHVLDLYGSNQPEVKLNNTSPIHKALGFIGLH